jgi:hypothetical protein
MDGPFSTSKKSLMSNAEIKSILSPIGVGMQLGESAAYNIPILLHSITPPGWALGRERSAW